MREVGEVGVERESCFAVGLRGEERDCGAGISAGSSSEVNGGSSGVMERKDEDSDAARSGRAGCGGDSCNARAC